MNKHKIVFLKPSQSPEFAGNIIRSFIEDPTMRALVQPSPLGERSQLGTQSLWEHSQRLTLDKTREYLSRAFDEWDSSHYKDVLSIQIDKRTRKLMYRKAPFIALVNSKGEFLRLLDRQNY